MLEKIKEYLKIDGNDEDITIQTLITSAELYLKNAGVIEDYQNELYDLAIKMLVLHWYENRESVLVGSISKKLEFSLSNIITQLTYCYEG